MKSKNILLALAIFTTLFGCYSKENIAVPDELVGVWKTSSPKYKGCYFELTKDLVKFVNDEFLENADLNLISKVEAIHAEKQVLYTIYCEKREGQEYEFSFYYNPSKVGTIRFKNQTKIEWRKD